MPSSFSFFRPRHIPGNYMVTVILELQPSETGRVEVNRYRNHHCGKCGVQTPAVTNPALHKGKYEIYQIDDIAVGDYIWIYVKDQQVLPEQVTRHRATIHGFEHDQMPFKGDYHTWEVVPLSPIALIDADSSPEPFAFLYDSPKPTLLSTLAKTPQVTTVREEPWTLHNLSRGTDHVSKASQIGA